MEIKTHDLKKRLRENIYEKICAGHMCRPLHSTTDIWARMHGKDIIELRMGWDFPPDIEYNEINNPFDPDFRGNRIGGLGVTFGTAWYDLKKEAENIAESFWL